MRPQAQGPIWERAAGPLVAVLALVILLALLQVTGLAFWQGLVINLGIFLILVLSLNLSNGFTGVFSLGHIGFMALGAYASAILTLPLREKQEYLPNLPAWLAGMHFDFRLGPFPLGFLVATVIAAVLFGVGHYYKGPVGMIDSGVAGLILGGAYLLSGRCLWTTILAHGLIDTTGVTLLYLGLA